MEESKSSGGINRLEFGPKSCGNHPALKNLPSHTAILEAIRSLVRGQQEEIAAALQDTLIHCIAGEKGSQPHCDREQNQGIEIEFDRLLVLAVDENDIIDHKLKQISETILKLKQQKKRPEYTAERSEVMESKAQEVMGLISAEDLDLTEYSDALVYRIIERITVLSKEEIRIRFVGGFEITTTSLRSRYRETLTDHMLSVFLCTCFFQLRN